MPSASRLTCEESVAENSSVWRSRGTARHDLAHVLDESHVEHAVDLVEHEHFHVGEVDGTPAHVIEQAARRGDHDIDAVLELADLFVDADAAVHGERAGVEVTAVLLERFLVLEGQLAGRREYERAHVVVRALAAAGALAPGGHILTGLGTDRLEAGENGQRKGRRLARSRLGAANDVLALECGRDSLFLDWRRIGIAGGFDGSQDGVG